MVTGGGRRLGRAIALALGQAGYDVAIAYRNSQASAQAVAEQLRAIGVNATTLQADLSDPVHCERLIEQAEAFSPLALLVNNAAIFERSDAEQPDAGAFDRAMALNLRAPYLLSCAAGQRMRARGTGVILQIGSLGGIRPYRNFLPYSLSKAGLHHLTKLLAMHFAPEVRVNAIAPATVELPGEDSGIPLLSPERVPLRRHATAEDITQAVLYAARAEILTGQVLCLDGGLAIEAASPDAIRKPLR